MMADKPKLSFSSLLGRKNPRFFTLDRKELADLVNRGGQSRVLFDEPLAKYTTMRVGGPADALFFPASLEDLTRVLGFAEENKIPVFMLGGGSNLLVREGGIRGLVVCLREGFTHFEEVAKPAQCPEEFAADGHVYFRLQAGVSTTKLVRTMAQRGFSGLEGLAGVVGTVGGALVMNAGTRHGMFGQVVCELTAVNRAGQIRAFKRQDLKFHYRELELDKSWYLLSCVIALKRGTPEAVQAKVKEYMDYRQKTQPLSYPNAGSIFKNPQEACAGELIERHQLKGVRLRGAQVSQLHGNWIINLGDATADDMLQLIDLIRDKIKEAEGIDLETEIKIVGERA